MITDDGMLISDQPFWKRVEIMWLIWSIRKSPELNKVGMQWSMWRFFTVGAQMVFLGKFRVLTPQEMKEAKL